MCLPRPGRIRPADPLFAHDHQRLAQGKHDRRLHVIPWSRKLSQFLDSTRYAFALGVLRQKFVSASGRSELLKAEDEAAGAVGSNDTYLGEWQRQRIVGSSQALASSISS